MPGWSRKVAVGLLAPLLGVTVLYLLYPVVSLESGARLPLLLLIAVGPLTYAFVAWERRWSLRRCPGTRRRTAAQGPRLRQGDDHRLALFHRVTVLAVLVPIVENHELLWLYVASPC